MVDKEVLDPFVAEMRLVMTQFYPDGTKETDDFGRIVHGKQWTRLKQMLDSTKGRIVIGGDMDEDQRYMGPTVVIVDNPNDPLVAEER